MTTVYFNFSDAANTPLTSSGKNYYISNYVTLAPTSFPLNNNESILEGDVLTYLPDSHGSFTASLYPQIYKGYVKGQNTHTHFFINVPTGSAVNGADCLVVLSSSVVNVGKYAYSMADSDKRYALSGSSPVQASSSYSTTSSYSLKALSASFAPAQVSSSYAATASVVIGTVKNNISSSQITSSNLNVKNNATIDNITVNAIHGSTFDFGSDGNSYLASNFHIFNSDGSANLADGNLVINADGSISSGNGNGFDLESTDGYFALGANVQFNPNSDVGYLNLGQGNIVLDGESGLFTTVDIKSATVSDVNGYWSINQDYNGDAFFANGNILLNGDGSANFVGSISTDGTIESAGLSVNGEDGFIVDNLGNTTIGGDLHCVNVNIQDEIKLNSDSIDTLPSQDGINLCGSDGAISAANGYAGLRKDAADVGGTIWIGASDTGQKMYLHVTSAGVATWTTSP